MLYVKIRAWMQVNLFTRELRKKWINFQENFNFCKNIDYHPLKESGLKKSEMDEGTHVDMCCVKMRNAKNCLHASTRDSIFHSQVQQQHWRTNVAEAFFCVYLRFLLLLYLFVFFLLFFFFYIIFIVIIIRSLTRHSYTRVKRD